MRIRQVKSLVGGETLVEPVITKEKEILFINISLLIKMDKVNSNININHVFFLYTFVSNSSSGLVFVSTGDNIKIIILHKI